MTHNHREQAYTEWYGKYRQNMEPRHAFEHGYAAALTLAANLAVTLEFALHRLNTLTTTEYSTGGDREIRERLGTALAAYHATLSEHPPTNEESNPQ